MLLNLSLILTILHSILQSTRRVDLCCCWDVVGAASDSETDTLQWLPMPGSRDQWKLPLQSPRVYKSSSDNVSTDYSGLGGYFLTRHYISIDCILVSKCQSFFTGATFSSTTEQTLDWQSRNKLLTCHTYLLFWHLTSTTEMTFSPAHFRTNSLFCYRYVF